MSPDAELWIPQAEARLRDLAGGYLHNTRRIPEITCLWCTGIPGEGQHVCTLCEGMQQRDDLSDRLGFAVYGIAGAQSGHLMRGYKNERPGPTQPGTVQLLARITLLAHRDCITSPTHGPPTHWSVVPSLSGRPGDHPLARLLISTMRRLDRHEIHPAPGVTERRAVRPENFTAPPLQAEHVLLIDDTWASGGHVQSAAGALKQAGAGYVTTLVLARWLNPGWSNTRSVIRDHLSAEYDPRTCPFTGRPCS